MFSLKGHTSEVTALAFSLDGKRLATGSSNSVKIWDAVSGQELPTLRNGHKGRIFSVAFSPDGKRLASAGQDGVVKIWGATPEH